MKAFRKIIALMLVVMMVSAFAVTTASAKAVVDKFEVVEFGIFNEAGTAADTLAANKTITVKATLQRVKGENNVAEKATVYAAVYSGKELVDVQGSTKTYTFAGTTQENDLTLTIPAGKTDLTFKAFLWDGSKIMPLAKPSNEAEITGITIGGVAVDNFDTATTTYTVSLPLGTADEPKVSIAATSILNSDVSYNEDKNVATVTVGNNTYKINYAIAQPSITNVVYHYGTDNVSLTETGVLRAPADELKNYSGDGNLAAALGITDKSQVEKYASLAYTDRNCAFYWELPDELIGKNYIPMKYYGSGDNRYNSANNVTFDFTVDSDVKIWFVGMAYNNKNVVTYLGADGVVDEADDVDKDDVTVSGVTKVLPDANNVVSVINMDDAQFDSTSDSDKFNADNILKLGNSSSSDPEGTTYGRYYPQQDNRLWTVTLTLPEGVKSANYRITAAVDKMAPFTFAYEFIPKNETVNITDVKYTTAAESNSPKEYTNFKIGDVKGSLDTTKFTTKDMNILNAYGLSSYTELDKYFTVAVANRYPYWFYTTMPDKFVGMKQILVDYNTDTGACNKSAITLTTDKNISVYVGSVASCYDVGAVNEGKFTFKRYEADITSGATKHPANSTTSVIATNEKTTETTIFKYDIIVPEGQTTATATIKIQPESGSRPIIFYETID